MKKATSLGEYEVFDAHTHFFSHKFFSMLASQSSKLSAMDDPVAEACRMAELEMPPESAEDFATVWKEELDKYSVAGSLLIASLPGDEISVGRALALYPERFSGAFFFDPTIENAVEKAAGIFDDLGFSVICFFPAMHRYSVADNENVKAIVELVRTRPGRAVFVHCGALSVGIRGKLDLPSSFDLRLSNPLEVHKLAREYPEVSFIIPHFGAGLWREALMAADLCPNVFLDTSSSNKWVKYESSDVNLEQVFRRTLAVTGPERLLFGTDSSVFPRGWNKAVFEDQLKVLETIEVGKQAAAAILGGNLRKILNRK